jgi:hypothetical protein
MKAVFSLLAICIVASGLAQGPRDSIQADHRYLEDQFYMGITYNFLLQQPPGVTQRSLSYGLQMGLIKDIPINSKRTSAIGLGMGYGVYSYYSNLLASKAGNNITYSVIDPDTDFIRNKVETHMIEFPVEYRWRNSTPTEYKFWRIYAGIKLAYLLAARSKFITNTEKIGFANSDVNKFQYGISVNFGYNTFNLQAYYALNNLFKDSAVLDSGDIATKTLRLGLIFYIL